MGPAPKVGMPACVPHWRAVCTMGLPLKLPTVQTPDGQVIKGRAAAAVSAWSLALGGEEEVWVMRAACVCTGHNCHM